MTLTPFGNTCRIIPSSRYLVRTKTAFLGSYSQDKAYALSLYNAINGSSYTNVDDLEFITLESAFFIKMRNDAAFVFDKTLSLYEHQSTYNPNMPLRGLFYFADLYRKILTTSDLYSSSRIMIPTPQYIVFITEPIEKTFRKTFNLSCLIRL